MNRRDLEKTKAFFTSSVDDYRAPYGRSTITVPRTVVFGGTVNPSEYLHDDENRRFWPVKVGTIDLEGLERDRDQLWAEARDRFRAGEWWWPSYDERKLFTEQQAERQETDPWVEAVSEWVQSEKGKAVAGKGYLTIREILTLSALKRPEDQIDRSSQTRVGRIMTVHLGWNRRQRTVNGVRLWVYEPRTT